MSNRVIILFTSLLLCTSSLFAQIINKIEYHNLTHISKSAAEQMLSIKIGEEFSPIDLDKTIKTLFSQGYFKDIYAELNGDILELHFVQKPTISDVKLTGYKENDEDFIKEMVDIKVGTLYDEKRIDDIKKRIVSKLSTDGKLDSIVESVVQHNSNGTVSVKFIVNEGETILINRLRFRGATGLDPELFEDVIVNKEHEFMGWFWGRNDGKLVQEQLEYDPIRIEDTYRQHGYMDAKVQNPFVKVDFDNYTAQMSYQVSEGEVYTVSSIKLHQRNSVIDQETLKQIVELKVSKPFNIKTFRDDSERIKIKIADLGYAFVQVYPDLRKDSKLKQIDVIYRIEPGDKVHIRNVIISGNSRTLDRIIRRELYLGPGDSYSLTDLKDSRNALGRTGSFESSTIEEKRIDEETMDLIVKVKEAPTGKIQLGGGYGSYGGFSLNVGLSDRNIFGSGIDVGIQADKSELSNSYSFNISNPRLNDSDFSGKFSIFYNDFKYTSYGTKSNGISLGTGHKFSRHIRGFMNYTYSNVSYYDVNETQFSTNRREYFESYSKSSISLGATFDNTDDYYVAREGWVISQSFEKGGIGAEADYFKSRTTLNSYNSLEPIVDFDLILRYKARYRLAKDTGYLPYAERYYMGGIGSVRGYRPYSLPYRKSRETGNNVRIGGKQTFSNSLELSFPLLPSARMRLSTFLDWGWIGESALSEFSRGGYGLSFEWFSPMGPLQLIFANAINPDGEDSTSNFEFTIGQRF